MNFEWDENKNNQNLEKHGLDFDLAKEVFADKYALVKINRISNGEVREQIIGHVCENVVILFVVFTRRTNVFRLISARQAKRKERVIYEEIKRRTIAISSENE